jgi:hypothetical protein
MLHASRATKLHILQNALIFAEKINAGSDFISGQLSCRFKGTSVSASRFPMLDF